MIIEGKVFPYKKTFKKLFALVGEILGEDFSNLSLSINFVGEKEIQVLNKKFRDIDKVTDVLSFPNLNKKYDQKLTDFSNEILDDVLFLGDIVICKKVAKRQAKEYGHSLKREVCFLAVHGLLHLLGYDHVEADEEKLMQKTTEEILSKFGVKK